MSFRKRSARLLHRPDEPLGDRDARRLTDRAISRPDLSSLTPALETAAPELVARVGDHVDRSLAARMDRPIEETLDRVGIRNLGKDGKTDDRPRILIDGYGNPLAVRPALGKGKREPRHPEPGSGRNRRQIDMPGMPRIASDHAAPADRCRTQRQAGTSEKLSHAFVAHRREQSFQLPHQVPDEVGVAVDRLDRLDRARSQWRSWMPSPSRRRAISVSACSSCAKRRCLPVARLRAWAKAKLVREMAWRMPDLMC